MNNLSLKEFNIPKGEFDIITREAGETPTLYDIVLTCYKYGFYKLLDSIYEKYSYELFKDRFMDCLFSNLAKLGKEEQIKYFYKKSKEAILNRETFHMYSIYKNNESNLLEEDANYSDYGYRPLFDDGLVILCRKKKTSLLKYLYSNGFKASLNQLKFATRTLNDDTFFTVYEEMNKNIIADYIPMIINELCHYSKFEPIKFLFDKIGINNISQESLNECLSASVQGHSKYSKLEIFKYLLDIGADITFNNYEVLEKVFGYGHLDILEFLYTNNYLICFMNDENYNLDNYIEIAIKYNKANIIEYIIKTNLYDFKANSDLVIKYSKEFNKFNNSLEAIILHLSKNTDIIDELRVKYPRQIKLQKFLNSLYEEKNLLF